MCIAKHNIIITDEVYQNKGLKADANTVNEFTIPTESSNLEENAEVINEDNSMYWEILQELENEAGAIKQEDADLKCTEEVWNPTMELSKSKYVSKLKDNYDLVELIKDSGDSDFKNVHSVHDKISKLFCTNVFFKPTIVVFLNVQY